MPCDVCWTHLYTVCSHVLDTVARPYFSICLLWRHNPSFLLKQECRPAPGLYTLHSLQMDKFTSLTDVPPLSALPIFDLYQSTPLTPQHLMPVWPECVLSEPLGERMSVGCSAFLGPYSWNACKCRRKDILISSWLKRVRAVTLKNNLIDWLKYLFKIPLLFPLNKDV